MLHRTWPPCYAAIFTIAIRWPSLAWAFAVCWVCSRSLKTSSPETDENDDAAMCRLYNLIDAYAEQLGAAFILVHHTSKGNQSGKGVTDVGSGAGRSNCGMGMRLTNPAAKFPASPDSWRWRSTAMN